MENQYSKVYPIEGETLIGFRYNYADSVLEYVSKYDYRTNDAGENAELPDWEVIDSIGLSRGNWNDNPEYLIEEYQDELDQEVAAMLDMEFGS